MKNLSPLPLELPRYGLPVVDGSLVHGKIALSLEEWSQLDARSYLLELVMNQFPWLFEICAENWKGLVSEAGFEVAKFEECIEEDEGDITRASKHGFSLRASPF